MSIIEIDFDRSAGYRTCHEGLEFSIIVIDWDFYAVRDEAPYFCLWAPSPYEAECKAKAAIDFWKLARRSIGDFGD
jgi:hypothetical protein